MMTKLKDVLERAENWPDEVQAELTKIVLEIDAALHGGAYRASSDELKAIDKAERSGIAAEAEIEAAFAKFHRG